MRGRRLGKSNIKYKNFLFYLIALAASSLFGLALSTALAAASASSIRPVRLEWADTGINLRWGTIHFFIRSGRALKKWQFKL